MVLEGRNAEGKWKVGKQVAACTLVCGLDGGNILTQFLFEPQGSTLACLPHGLCPSNQMWAHSPTHWANSQTIL